MGRYEDRLSVPREGRVTHLAKCNPRRWFFLPRRLVKNGSKASPDMAAKKKATKKAARKPSSKKAVTKRYTPEKKAEIVAFAKAQGRGGQAAAAKKFGASPISVGNWVKAAGGGRAKNATKGTKTKSKGGSVYARISALAGDIEMMEGKIAAKKAELKKLNSSL